MKQTVLIELSKLVELSRSLFSLSYRTLTTLTSSDSVVLNWDLVNLVR